MSDTDAKYRKLATEYAKLKSQLPVLKKAILDEQQKELKLKDELKEKDQHIRKSEQELESLVFRNDQLSKRVSVLQDELQRHASQQKKRSRAGSDVEVSQNNAVLNEELQNKISQNERLNIELSQIRKETDSTIMQLRDRIDTLEYSEKQYTDKLATLTDEHKQHLDKLLEEKALLEIRLENQEQAVKDAKLSASVAEDNLHHLEKQIKMELQQAKKVITQNIPFNDTSCTTLNSYNVPMHNRRYQLKVIDHLAKINSMVRDLTESLTNMFSYISQRTKIYSSQATYLSRTLMNQKLVDVLSKAPQLLRLVSESFARFQESQQPDVILTLDTASKLGPFSETLQDFSSYFKKVLPYLVLSIDEENSMSITTQTLVDQNNRTIDSLKDFSNGVDRICSHINLLAAQTNQTNIHPKSNQPKMLKLVIDSLAHLSLMSKHLSVAFNRKSELETQLPTAPTSLSSTDQCLTQSLVSMTAAVGKLSKFMTENYEESDKTYSYLQATERGQKYNPVVAALQTEGAAYLKSIYRAESLSVPYNVAIENMKMLVSSTESRVSLDEQVKKLNTKITKLEQDKEHWMLEAQLLKIKYDKQQKLLGESTGDTKNGQSSVSSTTSTTKTTVPQTNSANTSELGQLTVTSVESDEATREMLMKTYYDKRIEELTSQLQLADGKAVAFHAECRALTTRLQVAAKARSRAQEELAGANSLIAQLQDELMTTKKNYDTQLMTMSEALASMNGNLASQQDEIENLKLQLKYSKKGKR